MTGDSAPAADSAFAAEMLSGASAGAWGGCAAEWLTGCSAGTSSGSPVGRFLLQLGLFFDWAVRFELAAMRSCFLCALAFAAASSFYALAFARASAFSSLAFSFALIARI